jgi:hypothetical protein
MKTTRQFMNLILLGALAASSAFAQKNKNDIPAAITTAAPTRAGNLSSEDLGRRTIERRAVEAVIWGADFNQIVYWSRPVSWKNQTLTPNPDTIYPCPLQHEGCRADGAGDSAGQ